MILLGYLAAALIGIALGLIGGGGSILTVPVLVYLFGVAPSAATAGSLFVVGSTALAGSVVAIRQQMVDFRTALAFGIPSIVAVYLTRSLLFPAIPAEFGLGPVRVAKDSAVLVLFAVLMLGTAISMIRSRAPEPEAEKDAPPKPLPYPKIVAEGLVVGVLTGLVGAGGGFLIIPALVLFAGLPMRMAVGTSLLIIAAKSLIGFLGDVQAGPPMDWPLLLGVTAVAVVGIGIGGWLARFVRGEQLKAGFGVFVLVMGLAMLAGEILKR